MSLSSERMWDTVSSGDKIGRLQFCGKNSTVLLVLMLLVMGM